MRQKVPTGRFIAALSLTITLFLVIIVINNSLNESKLNTLNSIYNDIRLDALNAEIQYTILSENPCLALDFAPIKDELFELGNKLAHMEENLGKNNKQVLDLKKYYSILEARQWLFVKKASSECNKEAVPILYFYSNQGDCVDCEKQGFVLNYIKETMPSVHVYSFDANLDSASIDALKITYGISEVPSLVIGEKRYSGFIDSDGLQDVIETEDYLAK